MRKSVVSIVLSVLLFTASFTSSTLAYASDNRFNDVDSSSKFSESISYLADKGIMSGTAVGKFSPDSYITVRQFAVAMCRAYGIETAGNTWAEVSSNALMKAYEKGWVSSSVFYTDDMNMNLCRESALESTLNAAGVPVYSSALYDNQDTVCNSDIMRTAANLGLCSSTASPSDLVTRGEAGYFIYKTLTEKYTVDAPKPPVNMTNSANVNANEYLLKLNGLPESVIKDFNEQGWTFKIDFDYPAQLGRERSLSCIGVTSYSKKAIFVADASAIWHEFGHYIDGRLNFPAKHTELFIREAQNSILRDYAKSNSNEYFADCFEYYLKNKDNAKNIDLFKSKAPMTYQYLQELEACGWGLN